jgi:predicted amidohydrolase YtcJ
MTLLYPISLTPALFILLVVGLASNCTNSIQEPDLVLINGKVVTLDTAFTIANAIAIKGDIILAVGGNKDIKALAGTATKIIDLEGKCVIPGLIDAHTHLDGAALSELHQTIPAVTNVGDVLNAVSEKTKTLPPGDWIEIPKLFSTRLTELRWPSRKELDEVAPNHPVFLDGSFAAMVNSYALNISGITRNTQHEGVLMDDLNGEPTGVIRHSAFDLLHKNPDPVLTPEQKSDAIVDMMQRYNQVGITSVNIRSVGQESYAFFQDLAQQGRSTVRVNLTFFQSDIGINKGDSLSVVSEKIRNLGFNTGYGDEWVKVGPLKWQIDGGILTGTAFLREPWAKYFPDRVKEVYGITEPEYYGVPSIAKEDLATLITLAEELNWDFTAHSTGGAGVDLMLAAYEQVRTTIPKTEQRFSIIHGNFFTPESIEKMHRLGVYADMQPAWFYKDADAMHYLLGDKRIQTFHPYKSMFEAGVMVNGGSDHMVKFDSYTSINPYNPFLAMWSVITRKTERGSVIVPDEAITREQALSMYTINNANLSSEEDIKGTLEPGKLADLVVISKDLFTCPVDDIKDIQVEMTLAGGTIVYQKDL